MKMSVQKKRTVAVTFRRLAVAASIGLIALTSQLSHAATATAVGSDFNGSEYDDLDRDLIGDAELTDLSVFINLRPYVYQNHKNKKRRHIRKRYSNIQRKSYGHRYSNSNRFRSDGRNSRPIYKGHRRGSGLRYGYSRRRH